MAQLRHLKAIAVLLCLLLIPTQVSAQRIARFLVGANVVWGGYSGEILGVEQSVDVDIGTAFSARGLVTVNGSALITGVDVGLYRNVAGTTRQKISQSAFYMCVGFGDSTAAIFAGPNLSMWEFKEAGGIKIKKRIGITAGVVAISSNFWTGVMVHYLRAGSEISPFLAVGDLSAITLWFGFGLALK